MNHKFWHSCFWITLSMKVNTIFLNDETHFESFYFGKFPRSYYVNLKIKEIKRAKSFHVTLIRVWKAPDSASRVFEKCFFWKVVPWLPYSWCVVDQKSGKVIRIGMMLGNGRGETETFWLFDVPIFSLILTW